MTDLISSIMIEDVAIELDNEIQQFLISQKEVASYFFQNNATLIAIGPIAFQLLSELKLEIAKLIDKPIEKVLFT